MSNNTLVTTINPMAKKAILEKLRDPKVKQIFGIVRDSNNGLCAWGCVVEAAWKDDYASPQNSSKFFNWLGMSSHSLYEKMIIWNDVERLTFTEIANRIEAEYQLEMDHEWKNSRYY